MEDKVKNSTLLPIDTSKIMTYLNIMASTTIMNRGRKLYKDGAVLRADSIGKDVMLTVQGGQVYTVIVNLGKSLSTSCNCPYDWGSICKHEVAALLYLSSNKIIEGKNLPKINSSNEWQVIPDHQNLTTEKIYENASPIEIRLATNYWNLNVKNINRNSFSITIKDNYWNDINIFFKVTKNELSSRCTCGKQVTGLCAHQVASLNKILQNYGNELFKYINNEYTKSFKKNVLKEHGIKENEKFDDWFSLYFDGIIKYKPHKKGLGLIKLKEYRGSAKTKKLISILKNNEEQHLVHSSIDKKNTLALGFVIKMNNTLIEIIPITGKPNKNEEKLTTHIRGIDEQKPGFIIKYKPGEEDLLELINQLHPQYIRKYFNQKYNLNIDIYNDYYGEDGLFEVLNYFLTRLRIISPLLEKHKYVSKTYDSETFSRNTLIPIKISGESPKISFQVQEEGDFIIFEPIIEVKNKSLTLLSPEITIESQLSFEFEGTLYFWHSIKDILILQEFKEAGRKMIIKTEFEDLFENFIKPIAEYFPVKFDLADYSVNIRELIPKQKSIYISEIGDFVAFRPLVKYSENQSSNVLNPNRTSLSKTENTIEIGIRDEEYEKDFFDFFKNLHPAFKKQSSTDFYHLNIDEMIEDYWFLEVFEKFKGAEIEVYGLKDLKKFKYSTSRAKVSINIKSGQDWFDVEMNVAFGDQEISLKDVRKAVLKKEKYIKLDDGTIGILPKEWIEKFQTYFRQGELKKGELKISKLNFSIIDELFDKQDYSEILEELNEKRKKLQEFTEIKRARTPKDFKGKLRDYQKSGYNWLRFLDEFNWGGILADDMGLGKTIQILAFLLQQVKVSKKANLIVIPTSLLFNWKNEIEKFSPSLKIYFLYGNDRTKDYKIFADYNLIITTYGTMTRDIKLLRKYLFNYVILDESQAIKNPNSQRFKSATLIRAKNKIAMTGTPIENNTFDLFAQMDFINPGFLGNQNSFKNNYSNPIDKEQDPVIAAELQRKITPFVLRRTKEQVATELPPKTEDYVYCEMEAEQRKVYEAFKNKYRNMLLDKIDTDGMEKSKIYVLQGLTKLRQICDSPEILSDEENYGSQSIKIKELVRHIKEKTGNHKILIFSQFVKMLSVIQRELKQEKIKYEYLDGKSSKKKREASVNNFQENEDIRVFLISLKAGGTGLNLTAADYVYIVDPWWNPAVENQAIDRCYRIGQDKKVIAYRMICKDTIEEKIMKYQAKKTKIASELISTDESFVKQLKRTDIEDLFN